MVSGESGVIQRVDCGGVVFITSEVRLELTL